MFIFNCILNFSLISQYRKWVLCLSFIDHKSLYEEDPGVTIALVRINKEAELDCSMEYVYVLLQF